MKKVLLLVSVLVLFVTGMAFSQLSIAVDAEKDAFYQTLTGPDDGYLYLPHKAYNDNYPSNPPPASDTDISAQLWSAWDAEYLYIYEEVRDDIVLVNNATQYLNDKLELKIDPDPTQAAGASAGNYGVDISALDAADATVPAGSTNPPAGSEYARKKTDTGYVVEFKVKWANMVSGTRGPIVPAVGGTFGMAIMNHDNDAVQREATIEWAAAMKDNVWNNPRMLGTIEFLADNKLKYIPQNAIDNTVVNGNAAVWYDPSLMPAGYDLNVMDAKKDDFYKQLTGPDDGYLQIRWFSYNTNGKPDNDADLSAQYWTAWDETYLYLYEEVKD